MKSIKIKGKDYIEVNERVMFFRENFKNWSLKTEWLKLETDGDCCCKVSVLDENGVIKSEGTAFEKAGSTFINKTSHIENCETSAVGRSLGFLGIGIDTSIASAEEVQTAIKNQQKDDKEVDNIISEIHAIIEESNLSNEEKSKWKNISYKESQSIITAQSVKARVLNKIKELGK